MNGPVTRAPSSAYFVLAVVFLLVFLVVTHAPNDADMWWHLRDGQEMRKQGSILTTDVFSYTRFGQPWTNAFWLSDLAMYADFSAAGYLARAIATSRLAALAL